ncbi:uncharacterized protein TNCV_3776091 [Trichonephila clavipes]|nr:uncharacterized protein TNCV_3776091 [Trichonephila clavipes]
MSSSEYNKLFIRKLETPLRFFGSIPIGRTRAHYSAIADDKLVTLPSLVKMWTPQQKRQCALWLTTFKSVTLIQRLFRIEWNVDFPTSKSNHQWERILKETGTLVSQTDTSILKFSTREFVTCAIVRLGSYLSHCSYKGKFSLRVSKENNPHTRRNFAIDESIRLNLDQNLVISRMMTMLRTKHESRILEGESSSD